jgi:cytochrome c556
VNALPRTLFAALTLLGAVAVGFPSGLTAQEEPEASPEAEYRQSIMQALRTHQGAIRAALGGSAPMEAAEHHALAFQHTAMTLAGAFPEGSGGAGSRALPAIWEDMDGVMERVSTLGAATAALVEAARSGDSGRIGSALQAVQEGCRGCHQRYRAR